MGKKEIKEAIGVGILVLGIIIWAIYGSSKYRQVPKSKHYTIAKIYAIAPSGESGWFIDYVFVINGIEYKSSDPMPTKGGGDWAYNPKIGDRYYLKFLPEDPDYSTLCLDKQVPDSIKEVPKEGWVGDLPCIDNYE